jgi:hypothetical protein
MRLRLQALVTNVGSAVVLGHRPTTLEVGPHRIDGTNQSVVTVKPLVEREKHARAPDAAQAAQDTEVGLVVPGLRAA